ncbi:hypothetical protein HN51_012834 [Arachis hypogaea]|uniref:U-box domain-containing protein n=2 Tax=Arachis TaxID=3817 RepID=A0A6P4CP55_ARADU|nr:U-box domain-containing protein 26-like [Arachis duranensis]QHO58426.1 U-box domain-containing protein [Arachis hypogaea]
MSEPEMTIPHLFRCPISLDLFEDPVTLCTGQTYDRSSIEKWLGTGNLICPVTMQKLHDPSIVPNHTLRHLIHQWLQLGPQFHPGNSATIDSLAALKHTLQSQEDDTLENKLQVLEKINVFFSGEYSSFSRSCFVQLGLLPLLLELVFGGGTIEESHVVSNNDHMKFIEIALGCIVKLLHLGYDLEALNIIKDDESKLATFVVLFEKGTITVKSSLCHIIESASSSETTQELCYVFGNTQKLVHEIVLVLVQNCDASEDAVKAILALCSLNSNRESLVREGAIEGIITYISMISSSSGNEITQIRGQNKKLVTSIAMGIVVKLLELESGRETLVSHPNGVDTLVKLVFSVKCDQDCSDSAVEALSIVCGDYMSAREQAIGAGVMTKLLLLMQSHCATTTKSKTRMLLKLLKSKWIQVPK